ncbi:MAG: DsbC family protein [Neisseria sp.]|nr:DsbC family protein [Neisseria sp.]
MKKNLTAALAAAALSLLCACGQNQISGGGTAQAASPAPSGGVEKDIRTKLEKTYAEQELKVQAVYPTPVSGLYEVVLSGKQVIYTDAKADYMIVGDLIDINNRKSLTDERSADLSKVDFDSLPLDMAIKEVRGNGKRVIVVFSDPDCPFCKRLEHEFAKMTDITIYNFMMPLASLHPDAARKAEQIWCQPDRTAAWTTWMREGKMPPPAAACDNPVAETTSLGEQMGFQGTPALVFPNGKTQSGFSPLPQLEQLINDNQKKQ